MVDQSRPATCPPPTTAPTVNATAPARTARALKPDPAEPMLIRTGLSLMSVVCVGRPFPVYSVRRMRESVKAEDDTRGRSEARGERERDERGWR